MNKEVVRTIKFTLFSISAGIIEALVFALLKEVFHLSYWACYLPALIASVVWNFTLNREFTFKSSNNVPIAMMKVFLFYLVFTPASTIGGNMLVEKLHWNEYLVTGISMLCNFILEYLYDKYIVFKDSIDTK
jgi:putative flippase GtrA